MEIMLDTNILGRLADPTDPKWNDTKSVTELLRDQGNDLSFTPQIKREFLDISERPKGSGPGKNGLGLTNQQSRQCIMLFKSLFTYRADTPGIDIRFDVLHDRFGGGRTVHDLNIVASMQAHGINTILTYNERDFAPMRDAGLIIILTPDRVLYDQSQ